MTEYDPWNDIQETCESLGLHNPQVVDRDIWCFRGQDVQPTSLAPEEVEQVLQITLGRILQQDTTQKRYARLLMPLAFLSGFLIALGIATESLDGFAAVYQAAPSWAQIPWAVAVLVITILILRIFTESIIEAVRAYRNRNPYWKSFAVLALKVANMFAIANITSKVIAVKFM